MHLRLCVSQMLCVFLTHTVTRVSCLHFVTLMPLHFLFFFKSSLLLFRLLEHWFMLSVYVRLFAETLEYSAILKCEVLEA